MLKKLFRWVGEWRALRRQRLEAEYQELSRTIERCHEEIETGQRFLRAPGNLGGISSTTRVISENRETITRLGARREALGRKLGYI